MVESAHETRYRESRRITLVGAVVDAILGVAKLAVGVAAQSQALIADGVHSLSDMVTDAVVLVAARKANRAADADHPYGHARIETLATVLLGGSLVLVAGGLGYDAIRRLFHPELLFHPGALALVVAGISVVAKEVVYRYTLRAARRLRSELLRANAWHSRSDAISSIVVMLGVGGTLAGLPYLDAIAAVAVAVMIAHIGWNLGWKSVRELVDTGLDPGRVQVIREAILGISGVSALHMLRTRRMGADALVDVHILVQPRLSVSEGHQVGEIVRAELIDRFEEVADVTVHVDPEDDEIASPSVELPPREVLVEALRKRWSAIDAEREIERVTLHYLNGRVHVDVILPLAAVADRSQCEALSAEFVQAAQGVENIGSVNVYFH